MTQRERLIGRTFGRLTVTAPAGSNKNGQALWHCLCQCGAQVIAVTGQLKSGHTKSCGCLRKDVCVQRVTKHGASSRDVRTPEYTAWSGLKARCENTNNPAYANYGARGITVCERWCNFENFLADMGEKPTPTHSIERIDNDKGYSPENCKWATRTEQSNNRRFNRLITFNGKTQSLSLWAREQRMTYPTLHQRLMLGWSIERALTAPRYARR